MFQERPHFLKYLAPILAVGLAACLQLEAKTNEPLPTIISTFPSIPTLTRTPTTTPFPTETPSPTATDQPETITIKVGGDVMLGRTVLIKSLEQGNLAWPLEHLDLSQTDITVVNLESPLVADCKQSDTTMVFCSFTEAAQILAAAGIDVVSVANNHILDQKEEGYATTLEALRNAGILPTDENHLAIIQKAGTRVGILGINQISQTTEYTILTPQQIVEKVSAAQQQVDILIVYFHWGNEYNYLYTEAQQAIAESVIEAGADAVVGTHSHYIGQIVDYQGRPIFYSLGNLVFDQHGSETNKGIVINFTFKNGQLVGYRIDEVKIVDRQPELAK